MQELCNIVQYREYKKNLFDVCNLLNKLYYNTNSNECNIFCK
jgi:hypothetical protein